MLESIRKTIALPEIPTQVWLPAVSLTAFGWFLAHDVIHPVVIFLVQIFLAF